MQVVLEGKENSLNCEMDHLTKEMYYVSVYKAESEEEKGTTTSEYGLSQTALNYVHQKASRVKPISEKRNNKSHKHMAQGKNQRPRTIDSTYQRSLTPRTNQSNPFKFDISAYDLQVSERNIEAIKTIFSSAQVEPDVVVKLQSLTAMSQYYQYMQQQNYNKFYEHKRQHDIEQWLASSTEEDKKLYLDRVAAAAAAATIDNSSKPHQQQRS